MNHACREAQELLAVGAPPAADLQIAGRVAAHVSRCPSCRDLAAEQRRLAAALTADGGEVDELTRARWLQAMAPQIDELATRHARRTPPRPAWVLAPALIAALALAAWAVRGLTTDRTPAPAIAPPAIPAGVVAHLTLDGDTATRIAVVGPAHVAMTAAHLDLDGTALVDARGPRTLSLRGPGLAVRAERARFAAAFDGSAAIYVADGTVEVGGVTLTAGTWRGPEDRRAAMIDALATHLPVTVIAAAPPPPPDVTTPPPAPAVPSRRRIVRAPVASPPALAPDPAPALEPAVALTPTPEPEPPAAPAPEEPGADSLYAAAERALAAGDHALAARYLRDLVKRFRSAPQAPSAMYDLATLARRAGDLDGARAWLDRLRATSTPAALREPAGYLRCRLEVDAADRATARTCFTRFLAAFPGSPHAGEIRSWLGGSP